MKVVNLFAGPGAGKSTTAAGVFHRMKLEGLNVELVTEYAKDITWEGRHNVLEDQLYMLAKQNRRLSRLKDKVEFAITDSPLLLGLAYLQPGYFENTFQPFLLDVFHQYENVNFFVDRKKKYVSVGRNQTEDEARILDKTIKALLENFSIPFVTVPGIAEAVDNIFQEVTEIKGATTSVNIVI